MLPVLLLCLGDSIRMGWAQHIPCVQPGDGMRFNCRSSTYMVEHWGALPIHVHYDAVVFNCGLWDAKEKTPIDQYKRNLTFILNHLSADRIYFCTTTPGREEDEYGRTEAVIALYNRAALGVMAEHRIRVIDLHALCAKHPEWNRGGAADVHYTEEGYKAMAEYVKHALTP